MDQIMTTPHVGLVDTLCGLVNRVSEGKLTVTAGDSAIPLRKQGMDSIILLAFLVAIEDAFMMEWSPDVPQTVFASLDSIADYLGKNV